MRTQELLDELHDLEDAPWADFYGKPLSARRLATLLEPYGIAPRHERAREPTSAATSGRTSRTPGARYVTAPETSVTPVTPVTEAAEDIFGELL